MQKESKTNAMRELDKAKISYETLYYDLQDQKFDGELVSEVLNIEKEMCFKSLVLKHEHDLFVVLIPVNKNLDLKKCAKELNVKNIEMVKVKDLLKEIGYERGSVSPFGIRKKHTLCIDHSINKLEQIEISGGQMGIGLTLKTKDFINYLKPLIKDVCI